MLSRCAVIVAIAALAACRCTSAPSKGAADAAALSRSDTRATDTRAALPPPAADAHPGARVDARIATADTAPASTIWRPRPGTSWQWQLKGKVDTRFAVDMYDIDLFDSSPALIANLKAKGRTVICYFSAGSYEAWRRDAKTFPKAGLGKKMDGWDELWLDVRHAGVRAIMSARIALAKTKGCDGVEPDNVDGYANKSGFPLRAADQIAFNKFLAGEAHKRGLSIGLKNALALIPTLEPHFDWALNEQCLEYKECSRLAPFIAARKAVFHVEYRPKAKAAAVCPKTKPLKFDTLVKKLELDAWVEACP